MDGKCQRYKQTEKINHNWNIGDGLYQKGKRYFSRNYWRIAKMNTIKATVHTELITSDDGKHVFEVIKRLDNVDGENGYLISLYPTRDKTNIFAPK